MWCKVAVAEVAAAVVVAGDSCSCLSSMLVSLNCRAVSCRAAVLQVLQMSERRETAVYEICTRLLIAVLQVQMQWQYRCRCRCR